MKFYKLYMVYRLLNRCQRSVLIFFIYGYGLIWTCPIYASDQPSPDRKLDVIKRHIDHLKQLIRQDHAKEKSIEKHIEQNIQTVRGKQMVAKQIKQKVLHQKKEASYLHHQMKQQTKQLHHRMQRDYDIASQLYAYASMPDPVLKTEARLVLSSFWDQHLEQTYTLNRCIQTIGQKKQALHRSATCLNQDYEKTQETTRQLLQIQKNKQRELKAIHSTIESRRQLLERMHQQRIALEKLIQSLKKQSKSKQRFLMNPKEHTSKKWPIQGLFLHRFGQSIEGSREMFYKGVTIVSAQLSSVCIPRSGLVVFAEYMEGFGLLVIVDHGGQWLSLYGFQKSIQVCVGQRLLSGQIIGRTGAVDASHPYGLYFEVRKNGKAVNPEVWIGR